MDPLQKLKILLDYHEARVTAIRLILGDLDDEHVTAAKRRAPSVVSDAIALDEARRKPKGKKKNGKARRVEIAKFFESSLKPGATYLPSELAPLGRTGPFLANGYFKKKGDLYLRTEKPYTYGDLVRATA